MSSLERDHSSRERRAMQAVPLGAQRGPHIDGKESQVIGRGLEACRSPSGPQLTCHLQPDYCIRSTLMLAFVFHSISKVLKIFPSRTEAEDEGKVGAVLCALSSLYAGAPHMVLNPCGVRLTC